MKARSRINLAIVALLSFGLLACDGYDGDDDEEEEESAASLEQVFQSKAAFETAMDRSGRCKAWAFSGTYSAIFNSGRFSDACTVDFVRSMDADGDGVEGSLTGWIDSDGTFQAFTGIYQNDRNHWVAVHSGRIEAGRINGVFLQRVRFLDDEEVTGSCMWSADIEPGPTQER